MSVIVLSSFLKRRDRGDGCTVREMILRQVESDEDTVTLDFTGVKIANQGFFDEAIGCLMNTMSPQELIETVKVIAMDSADRTLLDRAIASRVRRNGGR